MDFLVGAFTLLLTDSLYLSIVKPLWQKMVFRIQGSEIKVRLVPVVVTYILMSFALYYFVILPKITIYDAAILGFVIYGVFDMTNMALFKNYSIKLALIDMVWGALLFAISAFVVKKMAGLRIKHFLI